MFPFSRGTCVFLAVLLLAACGSVRLGRDFDAQLFAGKVEYGVTTQDQVRNWLGAPDSSGVGVTTDGARYDEWTYYFAEGKMAAMSAAKVKMLQVKFDKQGIVRGYNWSVSGQP
jgi:outer membrane protein assembly factor BamE (lipoprotein component of BamABCDE complex)